MGFAGRVVWSLDWPQHDASMPATQRPAARSLGSEGVGFIRKTTGQPQFLVFATGSGQFAFQTGVRVGGL